MQQQFTKEYMLANCGCYSEEKLMSCSFMKDEVITLSAIIHSEIPLKDKFWFVCNKIKTTSENRQIAIDVATIVLPIFEAKYPNDDRPRKAIEAAKKILSAAAAAYAADYAAAARAAAFDADYAAAARAAAFDAANAADDATQQQLFEYLLNITK